MLSMFQKNASMGSQDALYVYMSCHHNLRPLLARSQFKKLQPTSLIRMSCNGIRVMSMSNSPLFQWITLWKLVVQLLPLLVFATATSRFPSRN